MYCGRKCRDIYEAGWPGESEVGFRKEAYEGAAAEAA